MNIYFYQRYLLPSQVYSLVYFAFFLFLRILRTIDLFFLLTFKVLPQESDTDSVESQPLDIFRPIFQTLIHMTRHRQKKETRNQLLVIPNVHFSKFSNIELDLASHKWCLKLSSLLKDKLIIPSILFHWIKQGSSVNAICCLCIIYQTF